MTIFFLVCAALGGGVLVVQLALGLLGVIDTDGDAHLGEGHDHGGADGAHAGLDLLSVRALSAGVSFFGLGGLAGLATGLGLIAAMPLSIIAGLAATVGTAAVTRWMLRLEDDGTVEIHGAVGATGTVYLAIPSDRMARRVLTRRAALLALPLLVSLLSCGDDPAGPNGISELQLALHPIADGLTAPVFLTAPAGDPRLFIVERNGRVRIVANGALLPTPFLDIRERVNFVGERGLLGMAFDPQYATTGLFFVYYVDLAGDMVVERFGSTPGSNIAGSANGIVITIPHGGENHHGGTIAFGPDGMLYVAPGDGGCCGDPQNNAQNTGNLLGKILRLDVETLPYSIPTGNPFIGQAGRRGEIWAYGLRNPWRYSFDAQDGMLYLGDVGQDAREEVNVVPSATAGLNFGWRLMEGTACYSPSTNCNPGGTLTLPALEYTHQEGCSVTGGYVYRGAAIPELRGHYLYSDYCNGWLRSFRFSGGSATEHRTWAGITVSQAVSLGRDGAGELYMIGGSRVFHIVRL